MSAPAPLSTSLPSFNTWPLRFVKITLFRFSFSGICCFLFLMVWDFFFFFFGGSGFGVGWEYSEGQQELDYPKAYLACCEE